MANYLKFAKALLEKFEYYSLSQVPRDQNTEADALAGIGSNFNSINVCHIPIVNLLNPATHEVESEVNVTNVSDTLWTKPLYDYLRHNILPQGKLNAHGFRLKASRFTLVNDVLYKKLSAGPYLRCVEPPDIPNILSETHSGDYGNHKGGQDFGT